MRRSFISISILAIAIAVTSACDPPKPEPQKPTPTPVTPSSEETFWATACSKWERIGHPAVVSETTTSTCPSAEISIERTIPSSTIERRSSGSMTARSFSVI